jgi:hypothetical protein
MSAQEELSDWLALALSPSPHRGSAFRVECMVSGSVVHAVTFGVNGPPEHDELAGLLIARVAAEGAESAEFIARFAGPEHEPETITLPLAD